MVRLSVNINKIATLRNARGGNIPNLLEAAEKCQEFGAQGITIHPRPDERHIRYRDARELRGIVTTEYNIEGFPSPDFLALVKEVRPHQVTLVPDAPEVITSDAGWDTIRNKQFLTEVIQELRANGMRVSLFMETDEEMIAAAAECGADRIELYTEEYANMYSSDPESAVNRYREAAETAHKYGLGINAGHDLNRDNLRYFARNVPHLLEVSIGHALISDALYLGLENTIQLYLRQLENL